MKEKEIISVLDTNIFLTGVDFNLIEGDLYTTPEIIDEVKVKKYSEKNRNIINRIQAAIDSRKLFVRTPSSEFLAQVEEKAKITGDYKALSIADRELIGLGLELIQAEGPNVRIFTNDYSMENLCAELGIVFSSIHKKGIKKKIIWEVYCPFCNVAYGVDDLYQNCERCGSKLKRKPKL